MYDFIRFLPVIATFLVFPAFALMCRRFLKVEHCATGLALGSLTLLPLLCVLGADENVRAHDWIRFVALSLPMIGTYVLIVVFHWILVRQWGTNQGNRGLFTIVFPVMVLAAAKYIPGHWGEFYPGKRFTVLYLGLSYVAFRLGLLALEVRNRVVLLPTLSEYLSFTFMPLTLSIGPISTYSLYQRSLSKPSRVPVSDVTLRFLKGFTKYLVVANLANQLTYQGLLHDGHPHSPMDIIVAVLAYYAYLYLNFSGYCDMVIAAGALCGMEIQENFNSPVLSRNMQEFWNRWHITLSAYMRDLVFSPLSKYLVRTFGAKSLQSAIAFSIFCVFLLIGIWHGVGWNYLLFGVSQGVGVVTAHFYEQFLKKKLGRLSYQKYMANPYIKWTAVVVTQMFFAFSLLLFANPMPTISRLIHSLFSWSTFTWS
jgi:D-alanyl-lipoteichoic acid acyltransferase DltB (MBOAT superfamily)